MINVAEIGRQIGEEVANPPLMGFFPGGFKPPTKGHYEAAKELASRPYITKLVILIGGKSRDGITSQQSKAVWDIYLQSSPNPKIEVQISPEKSPIKYLFKWFGGDLQREAYVVGAQEEVNDQKYFESLQNAYGNRVKPITVSNQFADKDGERLSGSEVRGTWLHLKETYEALKSNPKDSKALNDYNTTYDYFKTLFPESVINKGKFDDILRVLGTPFPKPESLQETKDIIPGGLAKGKTPNDLATKHKVSLEVIKSALKKGIKVEMEHTTSKKAALEIAMDHVFEDPKYYDKLAGIEEGQPNPKSQPQYVWLEYKNHNQFNPILFDGETLDEDVRQLLLRIADYFWSKLDIEQSFDDVTLTGSAVNYNYTPYSDIDLHIIIDFNKFDNPEMIKKFFDAFKNNWNNVHDLKLGKHNIELYIQDSNEKHTSSGVYSIMNNEWIEKPQYEPVNIPDSEINKKSKLFKSQIDKLVKTGTKNPEKSIELIGKIQERIKNFRQAGLDDQGEYSIENLAFKDLRNSGYLDKLSKLKNDLVDKTLSLNESVDKNSLFEKFMSYACQELQIQNPPTMEVKYEFGEEQPSFGAYVPSDHHIFINPSNRNIVDVLRTLAHELVHAKQNELGILTPTSGETGSEHENDANSIAGILMRDYGKQNPDIYGIGVLNEAVETKTAILIDGTSSAGKSMAAQILKAVPFYKATDPNQWVQIDSDMFGKGKEEEKRRLKHDHPNIRKWSIENEEPGIVSGLYRKAGEKVPENPYEDTYIEDTKDARAWYMAQEYKKGPWKKVIFDSVTDDILKYVPNVKHVLLHAPIPILLSNIKGRQETDPRGIDMVLKQYLQRYEATTSKPSENVGDPNTVLTKSGLEELLSQHTTDQKYIDDFIKKLGITGNGNYYIKAKNIDPNKTVLINVDQKSRDAKVAPAKLQQMFNKI